MKNNFADLKEEQSTSIYTKAKNGDIDGLKECEEDLSAVSTKVLSKGKTTLEIACEYLQLGAAEELLSLGVQFRPGYNQETIRELLTSYHSPLKQVIKFKIIKLMVKNGVNIEEFMPEIHRITLDEADLSVISANLELQELEGNVLIDAIYANLGMVPAVTPNSYQEMISLLREIRPELFDLFPGVSIEEFMAQIDNVNTSYVLPTMSSPTRIDSVGNLPGEVFRYEHMFSNI